MNRRTYLTALGAAAGSSLAGCTAPAYGAPHAGSIRFTNQDGLPHTIQLAVTEVGSEPGDEAGATSGEVTIPATQQNLTAEKNLSPEESATYTDVFTEPVWYGVECTVDNRQSLDNEVASRATFHPAPPGREYVNYLQGLIRDSGRVELAVITTENTGRYTPGISD